MFICLYEYLEERYFRLRDFVHWLPVIWADRHWDYAFLLKLVEHKLRFMREYIGKYGCHLDKERDCKNMLIAEVLVHRIRKPRHIEKERAEFMSKFPPRLELRDFKGRGLTRCYLPPTPEEMKEWAKIEKRQKYMEAQDYEYLGRHLRKHLRQWWD